MATAADVKLHIAGIGHVYYAPVDTEPFDLSKFKFLDESTHTGWTWLGDTSSENLLEIETDGGGTQYKRTWDRPNVRAVRESESVSATINSVNVSSETFMLGFEGYEYDEQLKAYKIGANVGSSQKALLVVMEDGSHIAGMYFPNTDIKGSFPTISLEDFTEIALSVAVLNSTKTNEGWYWMEPREKTTAEAVSESE